MMEMLHLGKLNSILHHTHSTSPLQGPHCLPHTHSHLSYPDAKGKKGRGSPIMLQ